MWLPLSITKIVTNSVQQYSPTYMLGTIELIKVIKNIKWDGMTTVKWYLSSSRSSLILLKLSEAHKLPHLDSGFVNNTAR